MLLFTETNEVEVAPKCWIQEGKCFWPPSSVKGSHLQKMIDEQHPPEGGWDIHEAYELKESGWWSILLSLSKYIIKY